MIDEELNKEALEKLLDAEPEPAEEKPVDLQQTLNDIESDKLFEDIINLKNKKWYVEWNYWFGNKKWIVGCFVFGTFHFCNKR